MKSDPDKKDTSRGLGKPPEPAELSEKPASADELEASEKDSREKLFESDTITVSAETQREWSMAERPRAKKEALIETLPPNQTEVKAPEPAGELATFEEDDALPERVGPTQPPKPRNEGSFASERRAPSVDVSRAVASAAGDRTQTTWVTPRMQQRRFRRAALGGAAVALLAVGVLWFVATSGSTGEPNTASSKPEAASTSKLGLPESERSDPPSAEPAERAALQTPEPSKPAESSVAPAPPPAADRSPASAPTEPARAGRAPKKSTRSTPVQPKPAQPSPPAAKTPSPEPASGKAEKTFDPTQPIYR